MDKIIKKYIDEGDMRSLQYVFIDALDVDPTFAQYEEDYKYCKTIPGFLQKHIDLTPFENDQSKWDENYWFSLKRDMEKNFSDQRMTHMRAVAKVYLAEKVERIRKERSIKKVEIVPTDKPVQKPVAEYRKSSSISLKEKQDQELSEAKKKTAEELARQLEKEKRDEERRKQLYYESKQSGTNTLGDSSTKKVIGIAVAVVVILAIVIVLFL